MPGAVLVTGASGFAGSHLLDLFATEPTPVVAWHRPGSIPSPVVDGRTWVPVDLLDRGSVADRIAELRPAVVYHCAGAAHVGRAWDSTETTLATNVLGTHYLLEGLRRASVPARVLIPSSGLVYRAADVALTEEHPFGPEGPYGLSKLGQELLSMRALTDGIDIRIARPFNHVGPRQDPWFVASGFARRIADIEAGDWSPEISVGNLDPRRDLTDVRDTVRAYRLVVEHGRPGRPYNVCSGRAVAIRDLLDMLLARARATIRVVVDSARIRANDTPVLLGDASRIRRELGWIPEIPLEQTLDDLLEYWRSRPRPLAGL
jgi:GDP-4-dehydro-6-deoxy-D-mannose reductase